jgi:hypothetical protein
MEWKEKLKIFNDEGFKIYQNTVLENNCKKKLSNLLNRLDYIIETDILNNKNFEYSDKMYSEAEAEDKFKKVCKYFVYVDKSLIKKERGAEIHCLCGHRIYNICQIECNKIKIIIGTECFSKFCKEAQTLINEEMNKEKRSTYDCGKCGKRVQKTNTQHGKCLTCRSEIDCFYKQCYSCRFPDVKSKCKTCKAEISSKYTQCYSCRFNTGFCQKCKKKIEQKYQYCYDCYCVKK